MKFRDLIKDSIVLLDGAMGTQFQKMGLKGGEIPERLNVQAPDTVYTVSLQYAESGSDIICTNTFGAQQKKTQRQRRSSQHYQSRRKDSESRCQR